MPTFLAGYTSPQPTFGPCPHCGMLVLLRVWRKHPVSGKWHYQTQRPPRSPVLGTKHMCLDAPRTDAAGATTLPAALSQERDVLEEATV